MSKRPSGLWYNQKFLCGNGTRINNGFSSQSYPKPQPDMMPSGSLSIVLPNQRISYPFERLIVWKLLQDYTSREMSLDMSCQSLSSREYDSYFTSDSVRSLQNALYQGEYRSKHFMDESVSIKVCWQKLEILNLRDQKYFKKPQKDSYTIRQRCKCKRSDKEVMPNVTNGTDWRVTSHEELWSIVKAKTVNGEVQLHDLVDGKKIIITESTMRRDLQLEDAEGVDCLPNSTIFEQLTLMGYEKISQKLTFYKAFFSPQWKFLIHTILQCLSSKTTA
ncbi:hypothetical protein Tco_1069625 [Tanacetum coccineum]|uniref:Uncharacterized protein n=1 Tax=Tanacetum coccineum TaxID=301880 RepID=A0ABQ5HLB5_9ASTR